MDNKFYEQYEQEDKWYRSALAGDMAHKIKHLVGDIEFLVKICNMLDEQIELEAQSGYKYKGVGLTERI